MQRCLPLAFRLSCRTQARKPLPAKKWPKSDDGAAGLQALIDRYAAPTSIQQQNEKSTPVIHAIQSGLNAFADVRQRNNKTDRSVYQNWQKLVSTKRERDLPSNLLLHLYHFAAAELPEEASLSKEDSFQWQMDLLKEIWKRELANQKSAKRSMHFDLASLLWKQVRSERPELVVDVWPLILALNPDSFITLNTNTFQVLVAAHAKDEREHSKLTFIKESLPRVKINHKHLGYLDSGSVFTLSSNMSLADLPSKNVKHITGWVAQAEAADYWMVSGSAGMAGRLRRWGDRHRSEQLVRLWEATRVTLERSAAGLDNWLGVDWSRTPVHLEAESSSSEDATTGMSSDKDEGDQQQDGNQVNGKEGQIAEQGQALTPLQKKHNLEDMAFNQQTAASFLLSFFRCGMKEEAAQLWKWLQDQNLEATPYLKSALILGYGHIKDGEAVMAIYEDMQASKEADLHTYGVIARALIMAGRQAEGLELVRKLPTYAPDGRVPTAIMNRILFLMFKHKMIHQAWSILEKMPKEGEGSPSIYTLNIFLGNALRHRFVLPQAFEKALAYLNDSDLKPDAATYTILLERLLSEGNLAEAEKLIAQLQAEGMQLGNRLYSLLIHYHVKQSSSPDLHRAIELISKMEASGLHPNEFIYTDIIRELVQHSEHTESNTFKKGNGHWQHWPDHLMRAHWLMSKMKRRGVLPNSVVYNSLIQAHMLLRTPESVKEALRLFGEIRRGIGSVDVKNRGALPGTWYIVLKALVSIDEMALARKQVAIMRHSGFVPESLALRKLVERIERSRR